MKNSQFEKIADQVIEKAVFDGFCVDDEDAPKLSGYSNASNLKVLMIDFNLIDGEEEESQSTIDVSIDLDTGKVKVENDDCSNIEELQMMVKNLLAEIL
ncbi:hypothetical protein VCHA53O466_40458 [Vibrio chagasii]|nr:hypothetical protein VCHA53O466_40458 [Vibrio chagasii]